MSVVAPIASPILIDTNLLVLLVVGSLDPALVGTHKNCSSFTPDDYLLLLRYVGPRPRFIVLPNIVTETSNLLRQIRDPHRARLSAMLGRFVESQSETYVESRRAVARPDHARLGLTDCAILCTSEAALHLLTVDFDLYMGFLEAGRLVTNFRHVIDRRPP